MTQQMAPRAPITKRQKTGRREKLAVTIDAVLFNLVMEKYQDGVSLSHVVDSALWHFFGQPKLSFQLDEDGK